MVATITATEQQGPSTTTAATATANDGDDIITWESLVISRFQTREIESFVRDYVSLAVGYECIWRAVLNNGVECGDA